MVIKNIGSSMQIAKVLTFYPMATKLLYYTPLNLAQISSECPVMSIKAFRVNEQWTYKQKHKPLGIEVTKTFTLKLID